MVLERQSKMPKVKTFNKKSFIINTIRRMTYRWPPRSEAQRLARRGRGIYECASCKIIYPLKQCRMDHVSAIVNPSTGFVDWNTYIDRALPDVEGWQNLCSGCHDTKTAVERELRKLNKVKKAKKNLSKNKK